MKNDEYAPAAMPMISANAKFCSVSPPKRKSARIGRSVENDVFSDRVAVSHSEILTIWS